MKVFKAIKNPKIINEKMNKFLNIFSSIFDLIILPTYIPLKAKIQDTKDPNNKS